MPGPVKTNLDDSEDEGAPDLLDNDSDLDLDPIDIDEGTNSKVNTTLDTADVGDEFGWQLLPNFCDTYQAGVVYPDGKKKSEELFEAEFVPAKC